MRPGIRRALTVPSVTEDALSLIVQNPYSGEALCEVPLDHGAALDARLAQAHEAQETWRGVPIEERILRVGAALEYFREHAGEVARDITLQMGKPIAQARGELGGSNPLTELRAWRPGN